MLVQGGFNGLVELGLVDVSVCGPVLGLPAMLGAVGQRPVALDATVASGSMQ
jgi:hypothetical protein